MKKVATQKPPKLGLSSKSSFTSRAGKTSSSKSSKKEMESCFAVLQHLVPTIPRSGNISTSQFIEHVIDYINQLEMTLQFDDCLQQLYSPSFSISAHPSAPSSPSSTAAQEVPSSPRASPSPAPHQSIDEDTFNPNEVYSSYRSPLSECQLVNLPSSPSPYPSDDIDLDDNPSDSESSDVISLSDLDQSFLTVSSSSHSNSQIL